MRRLAVLLAALWAAPSLAQVCHATSPSGQACGGTTQVRIICETGAVCTCPSSGLWTCNTGGGGSSSSGAVNVFQLSNGAGGFSSDDQFTALPSEDRVRFGFGDGTGALEIGSPGAGGIRISTIGGEDPFSIWVGSDKHRMLFVGGNAITTHFFDTAGGFISHRDKPETLTGTKEFNSEVFLNAATYVNTMPELGDCVGTLPTRPPAALRWGWDAVNACLSFCGHTKAGVWGWQCATPWGG